MTTTKDVLDRLSQAENYRVYNFGTVEKALESRRKMTRNLNSDSYYSSRFGKMSSELVETPWEGEPDKVQWIDPTTDLDCMVRRNPLGAWCGYVGVMFGHPLFGRGYYDCSAATPCGESYCEHSPDCLVDAHGGITFSDFCSESEDPEDICHVPLAGRPDKVWWFGFDCGHAWDLVPGMAIRVNDGTTYRDLDYVVRETEELAVRLKAMEAGAQV